MTETKTLFNEIQAADIRTGDRILIESAHQPRIAIHVERVDHFGPGVAALSGHRLKVTDLMVAFQSRKHGLASDSRNTITRLVVS